MPVTITQSALLLSLMLGLGQAQAASDPPRTRWQADWAFHTRR